MSKVAPVDAERILTWLAEGQTYRKEESITQAFYESCERSTNRCANLVYRTMIVFAAAGRLEEGRHLRGHLLRRGEQPHRGEGSDLRTQNFQSAT